MPIILDPMVSNPAGGTAAVSSDGKLTVYSDTANAGMLMRADFSALTPKPVKVRFFRNGVTVRSGDPAWAPGGIGVAYDHEAPLGASCSWTAVPVFSDGTTGAASTPVPLTTPTIDDAVDCWVKPVDNPGLSIALAVHNAQIQMGRTGRVQSYAVPGAEYPLGTWDRRTPKPVTITLRTDTKEAKDSLNNALDLGPVLIQLRNSYGIDDFYAIPADSDENYFVGMFSPIRDVPVLFVPCDRPPTVDSPLFIPGRSWAEQMVAAPTWADRLTAWPTWWDSLWGAAPVITGLIDESDTGDGEGGL